MSSSDQTLTESESTYCVIPLTTWIVSKPNTMVGYVSVNFEHAFYRCPVKVETDPFFYNRFITRQMEQKLVITIIFFFHLTLCHFEPGENFLLQGLIFFKNVSYLSDFLLDWHLWNPIKCFPDPVKTDSIRFQALTYAESATFYQH